MSELSYLNEQGDTVFTAQYYINRGTCCKSNCLHCPFGTTIKNLGFEFKAIEKDDIALAQQIVDSEEEASSSVSDMLMSSAFGSKQKKKVLANEDLSNYRLVLLKSQVCAVIKITQIQVKELYLHRRFRQQEISKELIESYFFNS